MVSGATLGKEFISDVSFRIPHMAYLANWPSLVILNNSGFSLSDIRGIQRRDERSTATSAAIEQLLFRIGFANSLNADVCT